jgi:hypothetical protein
MRDGIASIHVTGLSDRSQLNHTYYAGLVAIIHIKQLHGEPRGDFQKRDRFLGSCRISPFILLPVLYVEMLLKWCSASPHSVHRTPAGLDGALHHSENYKGEGNAMAVWHALLVNIIALSAPLVPGNCN